MATKFIAVVALGLAVLTFVRWFQNRTDGLGRRRSFPAVSFALLVSAGSLAGIPVLLHGRLEARLSAVATQLVGHRVQVHCQTVSEAVFDVGTEYGYVPFDDGGRPLPRAVIKVDQCRDLDDYRRWHGTTSQERHAVAVHVLTHEAMHMRGIVDEAATECAAVQRDAVTARALGASDDNALHTATYYWQHVYPRMPDRYWSKECRPGGAMDERLAEAPWW